MLSNFSHLNRRHFLKHMAGAAALTLPGASFVQNLTAATPTLRKKDMHLIILWMGGGPSHMDLWNIHVGSQNQGDFKPIKTAAEGVEISEVLPTVAANFKDMAIVHSLNSREGDHARGTYKMNHVFSPSPLGITIPGVGSIISHYLGKEDLALPRCVTVGAGGAGDGGFLGASLAGFPVNNAGQVPENMAFPNMGDANQTRARSERRRGILGVIEDNFRLGLTPYVSKVADRKTIQDAAQAHAELYAKAFDVSMRSGPAAFTFNDKDNAKLKSDYGESGFGRGCLLAAKLVRSGVTCVEVGLGGWDMHGQITNAIQRGNGPALDKGMGSLIKDLTSDGMINNTMVLWMGDFGRTPRINQNAGRDHWSNGWSVVLGGGGIKGGQTYGATDKDGMSIKDKPVSVEQLYATIYTALGIDLEDRNQDLHDNIGRRFYLTGDKENAKPIADLLKKA